MMTTLVAILWFASLVGMAYSLVVGQYIGAATMFMNLILSTIMLIEKIES